jgi:hypothetical protein
MDRKQTLFRFRSFVSLLTGFSFLGVALTGAVLFMTPPGRVANWTGWTIWGLTKHEWSALHVDFSAVFIVACVLHIWLNIRPLISYFIGTVNTAGRLRLEWIAALLVCGVVYWGSLKPFIPFSSLQDLNERLKDSWSSRPEERPPVSHAELLTVEKLAEQAGLAVETVLENLSSNGIQASPGDIFGTLAEQAGYSPEALFAIAIGKTTTQQQGQRRGSGGGEDRGGTGGGGFGQQTLAQACQDMGINLNAALKGLQQKGITATADQTIRQVADENNIRPADIRQYLQAVR